MTKTTRMNDKDIKMIGKWQIIREIGRGGSGIIYEVLDTEDTGGRHAALKLLNREFLLEQFRAKARKRGRTEEEIESKALKFYQEQIDLFKSEYQKLISIPHPNIARAYEFGYHEEAFYFCSELIKGKTLAQTLRGKKPEEMVPYFVQVLEGLDFIHRCGLLHLDIKSENILVQMENGKPVVKIIDFGVAIPPSEYKGLFCGSPSHIAPEVAFGWKDRVDARSDLFSVGVLFYFCLTWGDLPFFRSMAKGKIKKVREIIEKEKPPPLPSTAHSKGVPEFLDTITMRLIAKEPGNRFYGNARAVINALLTHSPDSFAGTRVSYLIPPQGKYIGLDKELKEITEHLNDGSQASAVYEVTGKVGLGKTHFLEYVKNQAEIRPEKWCVKHISLPADSVELEKWLAQFELALIEEKRGLAVFIDNINSAGLCDDEAQKKIKKIRDDLLESISERNKTPELFESIPPLILFYTSSTFTPSPPGGEGRGEGEYSFLHKIDLQPFGTKEIAEYLKATPALSELDPKPGWIKRLYDITEGVPGSIKWVLEKIDKKGKLFEFGLEGNICLTDELPVPEELPPLTRENILEKYNRLGIIEKEVAKFMAVWAWKGLARPVTYQDISNFFPSLILQNIENLVMNSFIHPTAQSSGNKLQPYEFSNSFLPALIYKQISPDDREIMHDGIADYLKSDKDAIMLHKGYGSNKQKAINSLLILGRKLSRCGNLNLAESLLLKAMEIAPKENTKLRAYIATLLIENYYNSGKYEEAGNVYLDICKIACVPESKLPLLVGELFIKIIPVYIQRGNHQKALEAIEMALKLIGDRTHSHQRLILLNYKAQSYFKQALKQKEDIKAQLSTAKNLYEESESLEDNLSAVGLKHVTNNDLGMVLREMGDFAGAQAKMERKLRRVEQSGKVFDIMTTLINLAESCRLTKNYTAAKKHIERVIELAKETMSSRWLMYGHNILANIYHDKDEFERALEEDNRCLAASMSLAGSIEYNEMISFLFIQMGHCYKELRQLDKSILYLTTAIERKVNTAHLMSAYLSLGEVYFYKGEYDKEFECFNKAEELLNNISNGLAVPYYFRIDKLKADTYLKQKKYEEAEKLLPRLKQLAENDESRIKEINEIENSLLSVRSPS